MITKFELDKKRYDEYRKCAYLNLRDNGVVNIELTNCNNGRQPYVCKYIMDRCFNNTSCGQNGECINVPDKKTFECRCRIFYAGENCETCKCAFLKESSFHSSWSFSNIFSHFVKGVHRAFKC